MSTLSSKQTDELAKALKGAFIGALISVAVEAAIEAKGKEPLLVAKGFMKNTKVHPKLLEVLQKVTPPIDDSSSGIGTRLLTTDPQWVEAVDKLGVSRFDKRGMSKYFLLHLSVLVRVNTALSQKSELDGVMEGRYDSRSLALASQAEKLISEAENLIAGLLGFLAIIEESIPEKPKGFKARLAVWLWKKANGATKPDYAIARKAAEDFIATSVTNSKIDQLAAE